MLDYVNLWNRLESFHGLIASAPMRKNMPEELLLSEFLRPHENVLSVEHFSELLAPSPHAGSLKSMTRWIVIEYPNHVADLTGSFGASVKVSDVLRNVASEEDELAGYYHQLAEALDEDPAPRPIIADPRPRRRQKLQSYMALIELVQDSLSCFSQETLSNIHRFALFALRDEENGGYAWAYDGITYPCDLLPPAGEDGTISAGLMIDTGRALHIVSEQAPYVSTDEREQLSLAILFYPASEFEIEATTSKDKFSIVDPDVIRYELDTTILGPAIGSVHIDHYGTKSQFSSDPQEFEFKLHHPTGSGPDGEYEDMCFLVSDKVTYAAEVARE